MKPKAARNSAIIYGASGHGKVVADILRCCGIDVEGFIDDNPALPNGDSGLKILGDGNWLFREAALRSVKVALGIGDNFDRRLIAERIAGCKLCLLSAVHPSATIANSAKIASGVVIMPHAVVNADASIGRGAIVNSGVIVEHDCHVGRYAHLSPGAAIGGHVTIGELAWLGIGASVIPNLRIGRGSIVGAGATVIHDIDDWVVAVGTPARTLRKLARVV